MKYRLSLVFLCTMHTLIKCEIKWPFSRGESNWLALDYTTSCIIICWHANLKHNILFCSIRIIFKEKKQTLYHKA